DSILQLAIVEQLLPAMDDCGRRLETHALKRRLIAQVFWFQIVGFLVKVVGGFVILTSLGVLALLEDTFRLVGDGRHDGEHNQQQYRRGHYLTSHSSILIQKSSPNRSSRTIRQTSTLCREFCANYTLFGTETHTRTGTSFAAIITSAFSSPDVIVCTA